MSEELLSIPDVARRLGVEPMTVHRIVKRGELKSVKEVAHGSQIRRYFRPDDVERLRREREGEREADKV